ncbi:tudor domain-containing protein 15 [Bombina bombina]|uniref:tudor domain-containing protein 15 n=1 Tax=Bombina bombina TaxID=8345 RepID=UPI00235AD472|nr:tudor domain-containing protein 15 [Bombina bombina]
MDLKISQINCHPRDILVNFQGKYCSECEFDYHILQNEIQLVCKEHVSVNIGEFCLVQDREFGTWHRGNVVNKINEKYEVSLIDNGDTIKVDSIQVAAAFGELFTLPPKIVKGVFSNVLPVGETWSSKAVNYFSSLVGLQVKGHVQTFLPRHTVLLEIPKIINEVVSLNLAKYVDTDSFCFLIEILQQSPTSYHCKQISDLLPKKILPINVSLCAEDNLPQFQKVLDHLKPHVSIGTTQKVKISSALSEKRFYCRIFSWEKELSNLITAMCSYYETLNGDNNSALDNFGVLCAAKRRDGLWHRGVIQKIISGDEIKVFFIDFGNSETVSSSYIHKLKSDFLSLPMMAIPCSLSAMNNNIEGVRNTQLSLLKHGLLGQIIISHIDTFCREEHLFYVQLYSQAYELSTECHLTNEQVPVFSSIAYTNICERPVAEHKNNKIESISSSLAGKEMVSFKTVKMEIDSVHVAYIEYALNPSNFWIRTDEYQKEFVDMMEEIAAIYNPCKPTERLMENPKPGELCCALYEKDMHYYRAVITEVHDFDISVYFFDFGNTETVSSYGVKMLLPQFSTLPALAMCCRLAHACPPEDVWVKSANDFFKQITSGKALLCHVLAKNKYTYIVDIRHSENSENSNIVTLMVQAGHAEYWDIDLNASFSDSENSFQLQKSCKKLKERKPRYTSSDSPICVSKPLAPCRSKTTQSPQTLHSANSNLPRLQYKEYVFKPGTSMDVICSSVNSPVDFWCQLLSKASELKDLMEEIQSYYSTCKNEYKHGQEACIAKDLYYGQYYRACVIRKVSTKEAEVIFVDYGNSIKVSFSDLREILPCFLKLEGQAFRCSLSNCIAPCNSNSKWTSDACQDFKKFVNSSATGKIKCTIHALFSMSTDLCNAVSLEKSFQDACQFLVHKGYAVFSHCSIPSVKLHTYFYSNFDIKIGDQEQVFVTYIYNIGKFYCQLVKNAKTVEALMKRVAEVGKQSKFQNGARKQRMCIVKYFEDGNFYRALACPVESSSFFLAFFVDFGNSQMVSDHELLPIPEGATDIWFEPMQAVQCYLPEIKEAVMTAEVKKWFEENCIGIPLNATVTDIDCYGQLGLELCNGNINVNKKIKELLGIPFNSENPKHVLKTNMTDIEKTNPAIELADETQLSKHEENQTNTVPSVNPKEMLPPLGERKKISFQISKLVPKPQLQKNVNQHTQKCVQINGKCNLDTSRTCKKYQDLPKAFIAAGSNRIVYVSHVNDPSSFYIQLVENEEKIMQLAEELNKGPSLFETFARNHFNKGDLVVAQYEDDMALYRAKVKTILKDNSYEVEFIDYGNCANVKAKNMFILPDTFLSIPRLCIWVFLSGVETLQIESEINKDMISYFLEKVSGKPICCEFLSMQGSLWGVSLTCKGESIAGELNQRLRKSTHKKAEYHIQHPVSRKLDKKENCSFSCVKKFENANLPVATKPVNQIRSQKLQPGQLVKVKNIYFSESGEFFVTLAGNYVASNSLRRLIGIAVKKVDNRLTPTNITKGMICLAKSEKRKTWLRAFVEEIFQNKLKMLVLFIDCGAREILSMHNAKKIVGDLMCIPKQTISCKWVWLEKIGEALFKKVLNSLMHKEVKILILHFMTSCKSWKVEILIKDSLLMEYCDLGMEQAFNNCVIENGNKEDNLSFHKYSINVASLQSLEMYSGFVTAAYDPSDFFLQLDDSIDTMNNLLSLLDGVNDDLLPLPDEFIKPGCICLTKCFIDEEWCRSRIVKITNDTVLLILLDYGVLKTISSTETNRLKIIPKDLVFLPTLTYPCTLHGVIPSSGVQWSKEATDFFICCIQNHGLTFQVIKYNSKNQLEVKVFGKDGLAQRLISKGFAVSSDKASKEAITEGITTEMAFDNVKLLTNGETNSHKVHSQEKSEHTLLLNKSLDAYSLCVNKKMLHKSDLQQATYSQLLNNGMSL